jgi:hypothetical protein
MASTSTVIRMLFLPRRDFFVATTREEEDAQDELFRRKMQDVSKLLAADWLLLPVDRMVVVLLQVDVET